MDTAELRELSKLLRTKLNNVERNLNTAQKLAAWLDERIEELEADTVADFATSHMEATNGYSNPKAHITR